MGSEDREPEPKPKIRKKMGVGVSKFLALSLSVFRFFIFLIDSLPAAFRCASPRCSFSSGFIRALLDRLHDWSSGISYNTQARPCFIILNGYVIGGPENAKWFMMAWSRSIFLLLLGSLITGECIITWRPIVPLTATRLSDDSSISIRFFFFPKTQSSSSSSPRRYIAKTPTMMQSC